MENRLCICGRPIIGRSDKKYCSDRCRYFDKNQLNRTSKSVQSEINKKLAKNRSILKTLCPAGKTVVRKEVMEKMGYDLNTFSSLFLTSRKAIYYICYDFAFTPLLDKGIEKALIVTRQEYMNLRWNPWQFIQPDDDGKYYRL